MNLTIKNNLKHIDAQIQKALSAAIRSAAFAIEARAKLSCPVDTGTLRNSIQTDTGGKRYSNRTAVGSGLTSAPLKATVGSSVEYAGYVEHGTRHQKGKPFLTPAADIEGAKLRDELQKLEAVLKKGGHLR
jgi:HK97 gp10 family phage protein